MGKLTAYLKTFFLLAPAETYEDSNYRDYTGRGFSAYKRSEIFMKGRYFSRYYKREVAAYSEITKVAMLMGMAILIVFVIWTDIKFIGTLMNSEFRAREGLLPAVLIVLILNWLLASLYPRTTFLIKNFKPPK